MKKKIIALLIVFFAVFAFVYMCKAVIIGPNTFVCKKNNVELRITYTRNAITSVTINGWARNPIYEMKASRDIKNGVLTLKEYINNMELRYCEDHESEKYSIKSVTLTDDYDIELIIEKNSWLNINGIRFIEEFEKGNEGIVIYYQEDSFIEVVVTSFDINKPPSRDVYSKTIYKYYCENDELEIEKNDLELSKNRLVEIAIVFKEIFDKYQ